MAKTVLGLTERVTIAGKKGRRLIARIDTGATRCSIDKSLAEELGIGPVLREKRVRSAQGSGVRPIVRCVITLRGVRRMVECTVADRGHMRYKVLIGQNMLKGSRFVIDPDQG